MTSLTAFSLQSGSNGNSIFVKTPSVALLFDAGISGAQAKARMLHHGEPIEEVAGLFVSHDHSDHSRSMGIFQRKFGIPLYTNEKTLAASNRRKKLGALSDVRFFESGSCVALGDVVVHTIPTPHDGADGVGFVVEAHGLRLGILTDLGHPFEGLAALVASLDGVFLESNYDPGLLKSGPYPPFLKRRITNDGGHISNEECAALLKTGFAGKLKWAVLSHLSETNNDPALALRTSRQITGEGERIQVASRYGVSPVFSL